jgi:hypothetical protein
VIVAFFGNRLEKRRLRSHVGHASRSGRTHYPIG